MPLRGILGLYRLSVSASSVMCCRRSGFLFIGPPNNSVKDHKADRTFQRSVVHTLPFQIDYLLLSRTQEAHKETKHNVGDIIMT